MSAKPLFQARKKKIGLTALIDVVFILLLFFMLTSSFSQWRAIDINSPVEARDTQKNAAPQLLKLYADKRVALHQSDFGLQDYRAFSEADLSDFDPARPLVLLTEAGVDVEAISNLLSQLKQLGFTRTTLGGLLPALGAAQ